MKKTLAIDLLVIDGGTQNRLTINEDTVEEYAELIKASKQWLFPPLDVFHDGTTHFVADGFHRLLGAHRTKRASIPCNVHKGTAHDARIFGMTANDRHGMRMSRADKRACVEWLLDNCPKMKRDEIAATAGVSRRTVQTIVADRRPQAIPDQNANVQIAQSTPSGGGSQSGHDEPYVCPNCGGMAQDEDGDCASCHEPTGAETAAAETGASPARKGKPPGKPPGKPIKALTGKAREAFDARAQLKVWHDAIGRWQQPIDEYRGKWPGEDGDAVLAAVQQLYVLLDTWGRKIK